MPPLDALKLPPENERTIAVFTSVNKALNDIDRAMYPPVETLHERHDAIIAAYRTVGKRFASRAEDAGVSLWLQFSILHRTFGLLHDEDCLDRLRAIFNEIECLGYTSVTTLIYLRMIWAKKLADKGAGVEAEHVAQLLLDDLPALRTEYARSLPAELDEEIELFRKHLGI